MNQPRITIITPSFNQAPYLERTIRSVLDQRYPNTEYFVMDGGSTDGSVEIIRRYEHRLAGWVSLPDGGQTDAINQGLARATGEIIGFINSDDAYTPGSLHRVAGLISGDGAARWVVGGCTVVDAHDRVTDRLRHHAPVSFTRYLLRTSGMIPQPSSFWAADLFHRHGHFDRSLHCCFDYEFNCRLLHGGEIPHMIDEPLAAFRVHAESKGSTLPIRFGLERLTVAARYAKGLPLRDRYQIWRSIGYRRRYYAIQLAKAQGRGLWRDLARRPWWIGSEEIRHAIWPSPSREAA